MPDNVAKTQIIPIGSRDFRAEVQNNRRSKSTFNQIPDNIHIVKEHEAIHILGAWFGNDIPENTAWTPILEKIDSSLNHWEMAHPSVLSRRIIIQTVIGGLTQYLMTVQGMPKQIEARLEKREHKFIWEGRTKKPGRLRNPEVPMRPGRSRNF